MNDILSRFLVITDSEVDSYWMFCYYMDKKRSDFIEDTMMSKIGGCGLTNTIYYISTYHSFGEKFITRN